MMIQYNSVTMMKERNQYSPFAAALGMIKATSANKKVSVSTQLDIEIDSVPFHLVTKGDSAIISFDSFADAISLFRKIKSTSALKSSRTKDFKNILNSMGLTVYLQNHHFGLIGPKAGLFFPQLFRLLSASGRR